MKKHLLALLFTLGVASSSQAITIQTGIGFNPGVSIFVDNAVVTSSFQFAVGVFSTVPTADTTWDTVRSTFSEFTRATVAANAAGGKIVAPGNGGISATATAETKALFDNKEAYIIVGNGVTLEASTHFAVIKGTGPSIWQFPADTTGAASMNAISSSTGAIDTLIGSEVDNAQGADRLNLVPVPEPSASIMLGAAALGMLRRRRR